ncbi:MAG: type II toxin-antitoxin system RelE/ParE family toxin [Pseudomonadota bacterium]
MTRYRVEFVKSAKKEFDALPARVQDRVIEALAILAQNPYSEILQVRKLHGGLDLFRIRLGDYRVVYEIRKAVLLILVIKIGHRKDVYRGF